MTEQDVLYSIVRPEFKKEIGQFVFAPINPQQAKYCHSKQQIYIG
jgi:hypothetical protein